MLARAGSSVWEIAAAGKPAILVPYPFATADHQAKNAAYFVDAGGAMMIRDLDLDDVPDRVRSLLGDPPRLGADGGGDAPRGEAERGRGDRGRADRACRALDGRRLWFVGIGGAGLSAYAQLARAWGAEVGGWDRVATPYLEPLEGVEVELSPAPVVPAGWEAVVSSAYPGVAGPLAGRVPRRARRRSRRSIVVGGAHGKGTTAAMIAFALRETGGDPAWLIGAPVPQLGANAAQARAGSSSRATSRTGRCSALPAEIAVITNVELDHHSEFRSLAELEREFDAGPRRLPQSSATRRRSRGSSRFRASTTATTRVRRWPRSSCSVSRGRGGVGARPLHGNGTALRGARARRGDVVDDYAHHPSEIAATIAAAREAYPGRRVRVLFQPHLVSRTRHLARELAAALAAADDVVVTEHLPRARGADRRRQRQARRRRALRSRRARRLDPRRSRRRPHTSRGGASRATSLLVLGAGDIDRAPALIAERLAPVSALEEGVALSRFTTIGTGGPAGSFARPEIARGARRAAGVGRGEGLAGRGDRSRLEPARRTTTASTRSCCKLGGELARSRIEGRDTGRGRRGGERGLPPPRARRRARRVRVRLGDPGHGRRRRAR